MLNKLLGALRAGLLSQIDVFLLLRRQGNRAGASDDTEQGFLNLRIHAHTLVDELLRIRKAAARCAELGLECHAGHGLSYADVAPIAAIPEVRELNIGHFLVGEAIFVGLDQAIREMRRIMDAARAGGAAA